MSVFYRRNVNVFCEYEKRKILSSPLETVDHLTQKAFIVIFPRVSILFISIFVTGVTGREDLAKCTCFLTVLKDAYLAHNLQMPMNVL
jgi:hypothetical protein